MLNALLGLKDRMSQTFIEGKRVSFTVVKADDCIVTSIKNMNNKYVVQLGCGKKKTKNVSKALLGHLKEAIKDAKFAPLFLREVSSDTNLNLSVGDKVRIDTVFQKGDTISATGISKGKGFAGGVKRWGFAGGPKTHGQSDRHRAPGSIGQGTTPGRVLKGKKMAGRLGNEKVTVRNLKVINVLPELGEIWVSGSLPGTKGSWVFLKKVKPEGSLNLEESQIKESSSAMT